MSDSLDMQDFTKVVSDRICGEDLIAGPKTITVTTTARYAENGIDKIAISFEGDQGKPFKPCKTVCRLILRGWGRKTSDYAGRSMTLYRDPNVMFGKDKAGGVRISHMSHITQKLECSLQERKGRLKSYVVIPLVDHPDIKSAEQDHTMTAQSIDNALVESGRQAAMNGVDAYKSWWTDLTKEQRLSLDDAGHHLKFKEASSAVDAKDNF